MDWTRFSNPTRLPGVVRLVSTSVPVDMGNAAVQRGLSARSRAEGGGMVTDAQLVVWNAGAVTYFGEPT